VIERQGIHDFLSTLAGKDVAFGDDDSLLAAQLIDSLAVAQLIVYLEDTYKVEFDAEELTPENLDTVNSIAAFLERKGVPAGR
jgi:acyl carrier protein